jgi:hypothetical protein
MTTNRTTSTPARFAASAVPTDGLYLVIDRTDSIIVTRIKGRAAARDLAATLTAIDPAPRPADEADAATDEAIAKAATKRTSHADCDHASTKLARSICRREARKANA